MENKVAEAQDKPRPVVAVAGASGFIGQALPAHDAAFRWVGLTRGRSGGGLYDEMRVCDLFSLADTERALAGAKYAVYLVHSMLPSAKLVQGSFEDFDYLCADNFARAAERVGVEQIVYVSGLQPEAGSNSKHLKSREEVERVLGSRGVPVTILRAGLVIGAGGSSFEILARLVQRLPFLVTPTWTRTKTQPIALTDMIKLLHYVLGRSSTFGQIYDVGGPEVLTYQEMMDMTARELQIPRPMMGVPLLSPQLSTLWVSLVTGAPTELVGPLIRSMTVPMVAKDRRLQEMANVPGETFVNAIREAINRTNQVTKGPTPAAFQSGHVQAAVRSTPVAYQKAPPSLRGNRVRSIQRLPLPPGKDAAWVAEEYMRWVETLRGLRCSVKDGTCTFYLGGSKRPLLRLTFDAGESDRDRQTFRVSGGALAVRGDNGKLEFRVAYDRKSVFSYVHDFWPRLPWPVYENTQAVGHLFVMSAFGRHLAHLRT